MQKIVYKNWISWVSVLAVGVLLGLNFLFAKLSQRTQNNRRIAQTDSEAQWRAPSERATRLGVLGFETLGADLAWIGAVAYYGEFELADQRPRHLKSYAEAIVGLDPQFKPVYNWYSSAYLNTHYPPTLKKIQKANAFLERGMEVFPTDYELPMSAGMNYIGYPDHLSKKDRLVGYQEAIEYLSKAARLEGSPPHLPFTIAWLSERVRQLRSEIEGEQVELSAEESRSQRIDFFREMYFLVEDEGTRERIRQNLKNMGAEEALLARTQEYTQTLRQKQLETNAYLPTDLWIAVNAATP
jgi:tetratricopeptide (TPR) repeat protein